jgi:hypothetical protein
VQKEKPKGFPDFTMGFLVGKHCRVLQGNPCNENRIPAMRTGFPAMKTSFSL